MVTSSWLPSLTTNALAFGAASFASSVLCTLFSLYVTPVFTSVYQVKRDSANCSCCFDSVVMGRYSGWSGLEVAHNIVCCIPGALVGV